MNISDLKILKSNLKKIQFGYLSQLIMLVVEELKLLTKFQKLNIRKTI